MNKNHFINIRGMTLTELVVSIGILGVLTGLVLIGLSYYRGAADRAKGLSNLRQIGVGAQLYINEHNGEFPGLQFITNTEGGGIRDYLGMRYAENRIGRQDSTVFSSPAIQRGPYPSGDRFAVSYSVNGHLFTQRWRPEDMHFDRVLENAYLIREPSRTMFFSDRLKAIPLPDDPSVYWYGRYIRGPQWNSDRLQFPYNGKQQVLFLDGHIAELGPDDVPKNYRDPFWTGGSYELLSEYQQAEN